MGSRTVGQHRSSLGTLILCSLLYLVALVLAIGISAGLKVKVSRIAVYEIQDTGLPFEGPATGETIQVLRKPTTAGSGAHTESAVAYRVRGEHPLAILGVTVVKGAAMSSAGDVVVSQSLSRKLFGQEAVSQPINLDGEVFLVCGVYRMPLGLPVWFPEEDSLYCMETGEVDGPGIFVVCFAPGTQSMEDLYIRRMQQSLTGYAPLYQWSLWAEFAWKCMVWVGLVCCFAALFPVCRRLWREQLVQPFLELYRDEALSRCLVRLWTRELVALLGIGWGAVLLVLLAQTTFPVLPLPPEIMPSFLSHVGEFLRNGIALRQYGLAHPAPVLPLVQWAQGCLQCAWVLLAVGVHCALAICKALRRLFLSET